MGRYCSLLKREFWSSDILQSKKRRLKEKIEADVGALVQFLLDERDSLLESLDAEEVATMAVIDDNLRIVEKEAKAVDKAIADIHSHISGKTSFEVSLSCEVCELEVYQPYFHFCTHMNQSFKKAWNFSVLELQTKPTTVCI